MLPLVPSNPIWCCLSFYSKPELESPQSSESDCPILGALVNWESENLSIRQGPHQTRRVRGKGRLLKINELAL